MFLVELTHEVNGQHRYAQLGLPATDFELLDALEKIHADPETAISIEPCEYQSFRSIEQFLPEKGLLTEMNALASELSKLDSEQSTAFEGLLQIEKAKGRDSIDLNTLRRFAISAGANCCSVDPAWTDDDLGRFYAENDLIPAVKGIPDSIFELLDFEILGGRVRAEEGGVFVSPSINCTGGYVRQHSDLIQECPEVGIPQRPDYTILLEIFIGDPSYDNGKVVLLPLPAAPQDMNAALEAIGATSWKETGVRCVDSCAPQLIEAIDSDESIAHINRLAQKLSELEPRQLIKFKAILDATEDHTILGATLIASDLEKYHFTPQHASPKDMGLDFLRSSMGDAAAEELLPFVNIYAYGQHLMDDQGCKQTDYGIVSKDEEQIMAPPTPKRSQGGMTMTMK